MRCLVSEENARLTVQAALKWGINHIETARGYGKSETYLGAILSDAKIVNRSQIYLTTKIPPAPHADLLEKQLDESLTRLQTDYLDCLAIHGLNTPEHLTWVTSKQGCWPAIQRALDDGRIRQIGFSTHAPLDIILAALQTDLFSFVNLHYYYFFQRNLPAITLAHQKDLGIFIISPGDKGGQLYTPPAKLTQLCHPFSPLQLTYRFLLADPRITTLSVGPATPQELDWPLSLANGTAPLTPEELQAFQRLEKQAILALSSEKCSQCYACLPCPENINIPEILRLRNLALAYDMTRFGQYRYQMLENAGHWFPGTRGNRCTECGDCLPRCPENLPIPQLLQDTHQRLNGPSRRRLWQSTPEKL